MTAAMGMNLGTIDDPRVRKKPPLLQAGADSKSYNQHNFAVTQALVGLLAQSSLMKSSGIAELTKGTNLHFFMK